MTDNDKKILGMADLRIQLVALTLQDLSPEAIKELSESKNRDAHGEIENLESLAKDFGEAAYKK